MSTYLWQALCTAESALRFLVSDESDVHLIGHDTDEARSRIRYALKWIAQAKCPSTDTKEEDSNDVVRDD